MGFEAQGVAGLNITPIFMLHLKILRKGMEINGVKPLFRDIKSCISAGNQTYFLRVFPYLVGNYLDSSGYLEGIFGGSKFP
jgi:hypothetical protein